PMGTGDGGDAGSPGPDATMSDVATMDAPPGDAPAPSDVPIDTAGCGLPGAACCPVGGQGMGDQGCRGGAGAPRGTMGQACCSRATPCSGTLLCNAGTCVGCGARGGPCCAGNLCSNMNDVCVGGSCQECGRPGGPCCPGMACFGGATCGSTNFCLP